MTRKLTVERYQFTVRHPENWSAVHKNGVVWVVNAPQEKATADALDKLAQTYITVETRKDHAQALQRLREIASEYEASASFISVGGWPALQRSVTIEKEQPGIDRQNSPGQRVFVVTTAVATGNLLIRSEGRMSPDAPRRTRYEMISIHTGMILPAPGDASHTRRELEELRAAPRVERRRPLHFRASVILPQMRALTTTKPSRVPMRRHVEEPASGGAESGLAGAETEIAVSTDGKKIVIALPFLYVTSADGGQTFTAPQAFPMTDGGDDSLAYGQSGNFYEGTLLTAASSVVINVSTYSANSVQPFTFLNKPYTCPPSGINQCGFTNGATPPVPLADQEHIAADRFNPGSNGDQVYVAWRQGNGNYGIVCSPDSGQTFSGAQFTPGDFPRITVGQDGSVYVAYVLGSSVYLDKYSPCKSQTPLSHQDNFPITVATNVSVPCPVPGLDRCNSGNTLASPMAAVDDQAPSYIYVAYATNTSSPAVCPASQPACNENVEVVSLSNGGQLFDSGPLAVNETVTARRYMPWICTSASHAFVSWYDRRAANTPGAADDLTDYYLGSVNALQGSFLVAGPETRLSGNSDPQCASGWACSARSSNDATSCSVPAQVAGVCQLPCANGGSGGNCPGGNNGSLARCDFNAPGDGGPNACNPGETCQAQTLGGCPKYGDYNGNTCAAGHIYNVWASATPPLGLAAPAGINLYFSSTDVSAALCDHDCQVQGAQAQSCSSTCSDYKTVAVKYQVCVEQAAEKQGQCYEDCRAHKPGFLPELNCSQRQAEAIVQCRATCDGNLGSLEKNCRKCMSDAAVIFSDPKCAPKANLPPSCANAKGQQQNTPSAGTRTETIAPNGAKQKATDNPSGCVFTGKHRCKTEKLPETPK